MKKLKILFILITIRTFCSANGYHKKFELLRINNEFEIQIDTMQITKGKQTSAISVKNNHDSINFNCDGPFVIYKNDAVICHSIIPYKDSFFVEKKEITKSDSLYCHVSGTNEKFGFLLKKEITVEKDTYTLPKKMLVVSDIEGEFNALTSLLKSGKVIDENLKWKFGDGHLVLLGDFFDRGTNVTECLWLIYKLETEAEEKGGKVHFLLGNHEIMNMKNINDFAHKKYSFSSDTLNIPYTDWYSNNSELGNWLRSKNGVELIGDFLFVHAGISKEIIKKGHSLHDINNGIRSIINENNSFKEIIKNEFIGKEGPLNYRGIGNEKEDIKDVKTTLKTFKAKKMIIGHTLMEHIKYIYEEKVIAMDIDQHVDLNTTRIYSLYYQNNQFYTIDNKGIKIELK